MQKKSENKKSKRKFSFILCFSLIAFAVYFVIMWTSQNTEIKEKKQQYESVSAQCVQQEKENEELILAIRDVIKES